MPNGRSRGGRRMLLRPPQTEALTGGRFGEFELPILYVCGAYIAWVMIVTALGGIVVILGRECIYYAIWLVIGALGIFGALAAVGALSPEGIAPFYGWLALLLALLAAWVWDRWGYWTQGPISIGLGFKLWALTVLAGWLVPPAALLHTFVTGTLDRSTPPVREAVDGLVPVTPWGRKRWEEAKLRALESEGEMLPEPDPEPEPEEPEETVRVAFAVPNGRGGHYYAEVFATLPQWYALKSLALTGSSFSAQELAATRMFSAGSGGSARRVNRELHEAQRLVAPGDPRPTAEFIQEMRGDHFRDYL